MSELLLDELKNAQREHWLPKNERKTILLLSDDLRMPSGVGIISREIVLGTCHRFNWIQLGAAVAHPEVGKALDLGMSVETEIGVKDAAVKVIPYNGYGDQQILRHLIKSEKPDMIVHFTDPRFWIWLYQMEHEVRTQCPLVFYHVWDNVPFPYYNKNYYRSCDAIFNISKQTHNIVRNVLDEPTEPWQIKYIPHGVDENIWRRYTEIDDLSRTETLKQQFFGDDVVDFVVLYNNRNIRRKSTSDVILAYRDFILTLPEAKQETCRLLLHTAPVDENGTDLIAVLRDVAPEVKYVFSHNRVAPTTMVDIYNLVDVVINLASAEGFGIGTLEAMMSERMIIANVTGGLQDQMGFVDENGDNLDPEIHFNNEWQTNSTGKYKTHGKWVVPVFSNNHTLIGSPTTPYIWEDRADYRDAAVALRTVYDMTVEQRLENGKLGRKYAEAVGMTTSGMSQRFIDALDGVFTNWKPRAKIGIYKA
jgi:hypothetical protein